MNSLVPNETYQWVASGYRWLEFSSGFRPWGVKRKDREPAIEAMRESGIAHTDSLAHLLCFRKQLSALANLYKALSPDGDPKFATVARVLKALGLRLSVAA